MTVGVIGLGRMGAPIATRLSRSGRTVWGFDLAGSHNHTDGVTAASSLAHVCQTASVVLLSLPNARASRDVCAQVAEVAEGLVETVVEMSTIGTAVEESATILESAGIDLVDAPVSGGIAGASTGRLSMMVAAAPDVLGGVHDLLQEIARHCFVVGSRPGQGQAMKLINNYVSQTALAATAEAAVFAEQVGLDLAQVIEVLNASTGRSSASEDKFPRAVLPGTYDFGFASEAARKDIGLYLDSAQSAGAPHRLAAASDALWGRFLETCPGTDFTHIHKYFVDGGT